MISRLAHFVLGIHILKKAKRLPPMERLRCLLLARRVYGFVIVLWMVCAPACAFVAACCIYPHFAVMIHLDRPENEAIPDVWSFLLFLLPTVFLVLGMPVVLVARRLLAEYWLLFFIADYVPIKPSS